MKKVFFSMAGIALLAGSALAFTTAKDNEPLPCDHENVPDNCTEPIPTNQDACCFEVLPSGSPQYYRIKEQN